MGQTEHASFPQKRTSVKKRASACCKNGNLQRKKEIYLTLIKKPESIGSVIVLSEDFSLLRLPCDLL
jgi:hypothetical protein